mgnify:FL=1
MKEKLTKEQIEISIRLDRIIEDEKINVFSSFNYIINIILGEKNEIFKKQYICNSTI